LEGMFRFVGLNVFFLFIYIYTRHLSGRIILLSILHISV
jgi:hypothetical protein